MTIKNFKRIMIEKAKRKNGIWENFGQNELMKLKDNYDYNSIRYGTPEERKTAKEIDNLGDWCGTYSGR